GKLGRHRRPRGSACRRRIRCGRSSRKLRRPGCDSEFSGRLRWTRTSRQGVPARGSRRPDALTTGERSVGDGEVASGLTSARGGHMDEVFPVLGGIVIGLATHAVWVRWLRALLIGILGVAVGALASWVSGELAVSWVYLVIDIGQVLMAAVMTGVLVTVWLRRRARSLSR